jgi:D-glycero-D-manno-heptose 1,7-bisphosphate phosphatase
VSRPPVAPRWVFLDRDGTINVPAPPGDYVTDPGRVELLDGAGDAIRRLNDAGVWVGVVTNQRGVPEEAVERVHERLRELLAAERAHVDGIWVCPHQDGECDCRKPLPGLLLQARAANPDIDFASAAIVGDSDRDTGAGRALGLVTVRIGAGGDADRHVASLAEAVAWLLS